ncbi:MAG TPA: hypothetical protein VKB23_03175 [Solirubrobacterales bacterium]|nr:hypothetical protein [Solirubrobacterales bacterium]
MGATCGICGRTILAGERVHGYFDAEEERSVCELCVARAERLGWRDGAGPEPEPGQSREHEGRGRLRGLLRRRDRRPGAPSPPPSRRPAPPPGDASGFTPFEQAAARFNSSEAGRSVVGLTRTLGLPRASVGASAGNPGEVRITIAWDLSWYQWGVDLGDELRPVFELGKGGEIDQLDNPAKQWNAVVGEDGRLRMAGDPAASR